MSKRLRHLGAVLGCWTILLAGLLLADSALAATYTFNVGTINGSNPAVSGSPSICSGTWARSGSSGAYVFTCSGNISTASGDVLTSSANSSITVVAGNSSISLNSSTVGTAARTITLQTSSGTLTSTGTNTIYGSVVSGSGAISLSGTMISGSVTGTGAASFSGGSVAGSVNVSGNVTTDGTVITGTLTSSFGALDLTGGSVGGNVSTGGAVTTNGTTIGGSLTSGGAINLSGGSVTGLVKSTCCTVTASDTNLQGGARSDSSGISITGGTIAGAFYANNNPATFSGVTMTSGTISGASTVTVTDSSLGSAESKVTITSQSGAVTLNNSTVYGDLTAPSYSTINVNSPSTVTGTCLPNSTPANACNASVAPLCFTDSYNRTDLGTSDWAVASRNGSFGVPKIVNNRLRLTDNTGNVATVATLQRLLPAKSNYVQVQFKYYGYNGNGADGVAVIFSDATQTPQPGGYGGSLGYAQLNGVSGFAGGWLGMALDEYGNFSNPTETRSGGPGFRQDSVSIRGSGSGTTGYTYLQGTAANLNPGIDISGTTAGPGHTYRITLDSSVVGKTMVRVERNTGSGFATLISSFDALNASGQAVLPSDFYLSLTGSTGGSNNIHELDDLQVCASKMNPIGVQIDHFELTHADNALTCTPLPVTVKACLDSAVPCATPYTGTSPALNASLSPATWSGLNFSNGVANAQLAVRAVDTVRMNVNSSTPPLKALGQTWCKSGASSWGTGAACDVTFADSGFIFDVPTLLARKPQSNISLQAVRKNPITQTCDPAFSSGARDILFTRSYTSPTTNPYSASADVLVNDQVLVAAGSNVNLTFGSNATAQLKVQYNDAGQITLTARYAPTSGTESGLVMTGSDLFVSKPYGLLLETDTDSACTADINCLLYKEGTPKTERRAGDPFSLRIKAVAWQSDGEALTAAALADNLATSNFQLSSIPLGSQVQAPVGGSNGTLGLTSYSHVLGSQTTLANQKISEVGVFKLTATPAASAYFGETVSGGTSGLVGRFAPAYLGASGSASLTPSCVNPNPLKSFSYQGQPMAFASGQEPNLSVTGKNRSGGTTTNYDRGSFWQLLVTPTRDPYLSITGKTTLDAAGRLSAAGTVGVTPSGADTGDGMRSYRWSGESLFYSPALVPVSDDLPFTAAVRQGFNAAALTDADGACYLNGQVNCQPFSFDFTSLAGSLVTPGSEVRLGRLRIGNAHGSELQSLTLPVTLESWQNVASGSFQKEVLDTCTTAPVLGALALDGYTGNLAAGETATTSSAPVLGVGSVLLGAPGSGNDGSVQVRYPNMPSWLHFAWDGVTRSEARGLAFFGIYKGATPLIFRREMYR